MAAVLIDSNIILDLITDDPEWADWSETTLAALANEAVLVINPIIYAEVSVDFDRIEHVDDALPPAVFTREPLPYEAGVLAGKGHREYRGRGGPPGRGAPGF